jgi:hypothetical protein
MTLEIDQGSADSLPKFFMNSIPKSGTHLLKQILLGIPNVTHHYQNELYEGYPYQLKEHFQKLSSMRENEFGAGHIYYSHEWSEMLKRLGMKQIFIIRDPRDIIVSFNHFILNKYPYHPLYHHLKQCKTNKARYRIFIHGAKLEQMIYPSIAQWLNPYKGWLKDTNTFSLTFEDLVRSKPSLRNQVDRLAHYLWQGLKPPIPIAEMVHRMEANIDPTKSFTFRSGKVGNWKTEFDEELRTEFKKVAGQQLIEWGYEKNLNW